VVRRLGANHVFSGLPRLTDSVAPQSESSILGYEAFQYGPDRQSWSPGFYQGNLPDGVTRYITNGAGTSAPSENLGFYFSGMRAPDWGPIFYDDSSANVTANTLITVDMSTMRSERWTNATLPDNIPPRANAELAWIPVSEKGVLVVIGGVTAPEEIWATGLNNSQTWQSREQSPGFMTVLPVYDVASGDWYLQNTTGEAPGQLTEFCSVVAPSKDSSSFNIYIYGGYDGLNAGDVPSDDVWILSVPSFTWIKAYSGTETHGRSGHYCVAPYPDQMLVIGGVHENQANCVEGGIIQVFNLNKLEFQDTYDPETWSDYEVPSIVSEAIGGDASGGSTDAASWSENALGTIFSQKYSRQMTHYYPYEPNNSSALNGTTSDPSSGGSSGISHGAIIGISVAAGIIFFLVLILCALLIRRRRIIRSTSSETSTASGNSRVSRWLNGAPFPAAKEKHDSIPPPPVQQIHSYAQISEESTPPLQPQRHEMAGTERPKPPYEMATEYNDQQHPRHSTVPDYAYNAAYGHTHSENSKSTSSGEYRPSPLHSDSLNGASPLRTVSYPPGGATPAPGPTNDISDPSSHYESSSSGTNETIAWPFPAATSRWRTHRDRARAERERGSESSSLQPIIMEEAYPEHHPQQYPRDARGLGEDGYGHGYATHHNNDSAESGVGTLPSPRGWADGGNDDPHRRSLFDAISPVNSTPDRRGH